MTDLKKLSEEMAEEYAAKKYGIPTHYSETEDFKAGFQSCLDLLAKQSGEYHFAVLKFNVDWQISWLKVPYDITSIKMVDEAALLSANAKIAQLEKELEKRSSLIKENDELKLAKQELEIELKRVGNEYEVVTRFGEWFKTDMSCCYDAADVVSLWKVRVTELQQRVKDLENFCEAQKVALSISMPKPLYEDMKTKLTTLEANLQKAEKVIEYVADYKQLPLEGEAERFALIDALNWRIKFANDYLQNKGG